MVVMERSDMSRVEETYRRIHPQLWRSLLGASGDPELASDAEAEALAQAIRRGDEIRDVDAWIWTAAFRILDGMLTAVRRVHTVPTMHVDRAHFDDSFAEFLDSLQALSPQQRKVVVLHYVAQMKAPEIATVLGSTPGSVRVQLHRAHETLRVALTNEQES